MATTFGKITELVESQNGKVASHNEALDQLDNLVCGVRALDISAGGTFAVTEADSRYACVFLTGTLAGNATITLDVDITHAITFVRTGDNGAFTCTIAGATAGSTSDWEDIRLTQGDVRQVFFTSTLAGIDAGLVSIGSGNRYIRGGKPATAVFGSDEVVLFDVATERFRLPANVPGSVAKLTTAATAQTDFVFSVNGTDEGTIRFAAGQTVATFTGNFSALLDIVPGDVIKVTAPNSADATAAGIAIAIKGVLR